MYKKIITTFLKLLGFGSTFLLAACYGPAPTNYREDPMVVDDDTIPVVDITAETTDSIP